MRCTERNATSTSPQRCLQKAAHHTSAYTCCWNIRVKGLCKLNPVYDITGGSSVSPNPRNEVIIWLYHLGKEKKFPNFTVLFEVFKKLDCLTTRLLGTWCVLMCNSPNKCSEGPIQPHTWSTSALWDRNLWTNRNRTLRKRSHICHNMTHLPAMYLGLCTHTTKHAFLKAFLKPRDGKGYETWKAGSPGEGHYRKRRNVLSLFSTCQEAQRRPFSFSPGSFQHQVLLTTKLQ